MTLTLVMFGDITPKAQSKEKTGTCMQISRQTETDKIKILSQQKTLLTE